MRIAAIEQSKLAKTGQEYLDLLASDADWIARTVDDVSQLRDAGYGPYAKLPDEDFQAFLASLSFKDGGVVTGSYKPLMASLTLTDILDVFGCFGIGREYLTNEVLEAKCVSGSWVFDFWSFCASNC